MSYAVTKKTDADCALERERRLLSEALQKLNLAERELAAKSPTGHLIFGLDLTGSRQPNLAAARIATKAMFAALEGIGKIAVKLIYYRGTDECRASKWYQDPEILCRSMLGLSCEVGETQIARLLGAALHEEQELEAVVFIGDHCEDDADRLMQLAHKLGRKSIPLFVFHECADDDYRSLKAKPVFKRMAKASGGRYVEFRRSSGAVLKEILSSVAAFSAGGTKALERLPTPQTPEARGLRESLLLSSGSDLKRLK
jgi:hypothetical protein